MDLSATQWALKVKTSKASDKLVLMVLAAHGRRDAGTVEAWPDVGTIAEETGLSERTVYRCLDRLCAESIIERLPPSGFRNSNTYILNVPPQAQERVPKNAKPSRLKNSGSRAGMSGQANRLPQEQPIPGPKSGFMRCRDGATGLGSANPWEESPTDRTTRYQATG